MKRGGTGFIGGIIIRHSFKWETKKEKPLKRYILYAYTYRLLRRYLLYAYAYP
jgi:hypothetical protein